MAPMDKTKAAAAMARRPPTKNPSRERMQAELALLRRELAALENGKQRLLQQKRKRVDHSVCGFNAVSDSVQPVPQSHQQDEYEKRRAAEQENKRLRSALAHQLQTVKTMIRTLQATAGWSPLHSRPTLSNMLNDEYGYRFSVLSDSVDRIYTQVDQMIPFDSDNRGQRRQLSSTLTNHTFASQELLMLVSRETTQIPFDMEHCQNAMWRVIRTSSWGEHRTATLYASTNDTVVVRMYTTHLLRGKTVRMTASAVSKRFVKADRMAIVWRSVSSLDDDEVVDGDTYVDESGWSVMKRASDGETKESVVRKDCIQWTPRSFSVYDDRAIAIHPATSAFTNMLLAARVSDVAEINELMENLLIDDCMSDDMIAH